MKFMLAFTLLFLGMFARSQETFSLLGDSLTNRSSRTWLPCSDTSLKQTATTCFRGKQYTFFKKDQKGIKKKCVNGSWTTTEFTWVIEKKDDKTIMRVISPGTNDDHFSLQLIKDPGGTIKARLTQADYNRKEVERFCIQ